MKWISPMLATLTEKYFSNKDWIFEKKFDGVRCLAIKNEGEVKLYSRNRKILDAVFPELIPSVKKQKGSTFILDGEIVPIRGAETFSRLQKRLNVKSTLRVKGEKVHVAYFVFDILYYNGSDLRKLPLLERKKILKSLIKPSSTLKYVPHRKTFGERYLKEACKKGWEGLIAKEANSPYVGKRSRDWLKFKCDVGAEFVICGYTDPSGSRVGFGALLIGYRKKGKLHFAGKVGTGYDDKLLLSLGKRLKRIERKSSPFSTPIKPKGIHFVRPSIKCEVKFTERTRDGKLRHPRFIQLKKG